MTPPIKALSMTDPGVGAKISSHAVIPRWVSAVVIVSAGLLLTGAVLSKATPTLMTNGEPATKASRIYADYFFARNVPLALGLLVLLRSGRPPMLAGLLILTAVVQALDMINNLVRGEFVLVPGLLVLGAALLLAARQVLGHPMWRADAWSFAQKGEGGPNRASPTKTSPENYDPKSSGNKD